MQRRAKTSHAHHSITLSTLGARGVATLRLRAVAAGLGAVDRSPRRPNSRRKEIASSSKTTSLSPARRRLNLDGMALHHPTTRGICAAPRPRLDGLPITTLSAPLSLRTYSIYKRIGGRSDLPTWPLVPTTITRCSHSWSAATRERLYRHCIAHPRLIRPGDCGLQPPRTFP
jgi:hypothetical protein